MYRAAPRRSQNRRLSFLLLLSAGFAFWGVGIIFMASRPQDAFAAQMLNYHCGAALIPAYLAFLATIDSPLSRPLRHRATLPVLGVLLVAGQVLLLARPGAFLHGVAPTWYSRWDFLPATGGVALFYTQAAVSGYGLLVALTALRAAAPGSIARRQMRAYALAFGIHDALVATLLVAINFILGRSHAWDSVILQGFATAELLFVLLLSYGILKVQLFDIDLRIKWTLSKGTVAGAFVAVFFIVSEGAQQVFSGAAGPAVGLAAAGLLVFALAPLQRLADRLSDTAMPDVRDTKEYRTVRKREVYRAAVESALQDGVVTEKERDVLATLAQELGLGPADARAIERNAAGAH